MSRRDARRYLYEEFDLQDRRELDDAILAILGIKDAEERRLLQDRCIGMLPIYSELRGIGKSLAQGHRRRTSRRSASPLRRSPASYGWSMKPGSIWLQFPEDFITRPNEGEVFDLPQGEVEVGQAMMAGEGLLRAGTVRIGGRDGEVIDIESPYRARFLEALSMCHRTGRVRLPDDDVSAAALDSF